MFIVKTDSEQFETASLKEAYGLYLEYGGVIYEIASRNVKRVLPTQTELYYRFVGTGQTRAKGAALISGFCSKERAVQLAEKLGGKVREYLTVNDFTVSIRDI